MHGREAVPPIRAGLSGSSSKTDQVKVPKTRPPRALVGAALNRVFVRVYAA